MNAPVQLLLAVPSEDRIARVVDEAMPLIAAAARWRREQALRELDEAERREEQRGESVELAHLARLQRVVEMQVLGAPLSTGRRRRRRAYETAEESDARVRAQWWAERREAYCPLCPWHQDGPHPWFERRPSWRQMRAQRLAEGTQ